MNRVPMPQRPLPVRLRNHLNDTDDCECVRCQAADEIVRLQHELWESYEQISILLTGRISNETNVGLWAEISDDLAASLHNSDPPTHYC